MAKQQDRHIPGTKLMQTKDGRKFWKITVSNGYGKTPYTTRFYWPLKANGEPVAQSTALNELSIAVAEFRGKCANKEVQTRAERKVAEAVAEAEAARLKTVRQYAEGVFMPAKNVYFSENTRSSYQMFLDKHILPVIGDMPITDVTPAALSKLILDFQASGKSHASCIKLYNILKALFEMAYFDGTLQITPLLKVKRPTPVKDNEATEVHKALTAQELARVLKCVRQEPIHWQAFITLAADTGARRGELCGLQWQDVDWKERTITIRRNLQYTVDKGIYCTTPKTGKSRVVDIGDDTLELLRELRAEKRTLPLDGWIFTQEGGTEPIHPQSPTRYFKKFGDKYGFPNFHPHLLRHTSASIAVTSGADMRSVADRLGHSKAVLLDTYSHSTPKSVRRVGDVCRSEVKNADKIDKATG